MSDVSCRLFEVFEGAAQRLEVSSEIFLEGTGLTVEFVRDPHNRVPWEAFALMYARLEEMLPNVEDQRALGHGLIQTELLGPLRAIGSGLATPTSLYRFAARWAGPSFIRCFRFVVSDEPEGALRFEIRIPEDRPGARSALAITWGALERLPAVFDLPDARVEAELTSHVGIYQIHPPPAPSLLARLWRTLGGSPSVESAAAELVAAQREVVEAHEAVVRSEREFRAALDHVPDGVIVYAPSGRVLWVNTTWEQRYGRLDSQGRLEDRVVEADRPLVTAHLHGGDTGPLLVRIGGTGGEPSYVECAVPVSLLFGGRPALLLMCRDVTDRVRVEEALRRSQETARALLRALPDHVARIEADGTIGAVAGSTRFAVPMLGPEHVGRHTGEMLPERSFLSPEMMQRATEATVQAHATGEVQRMEYRAEGVVPEVLYELRVVPLEEGATLYVTRDVTERRFLERQAATADRLAAIGTLAAGVAHEVNNPLTWVLDRLRRMDEGLEGAEVDREALRRAIDEARQGAERVRRIIEDLSTFVRGEDEAVGTLDVGALVRATTRAAAEEVAGRARLVLELRPVPRVPGNEQQLRRVISELIANAAQAIPIGRPELNEVRIRTRTGPEDTVVVEVSDTGQGIADELRDRIFEPFFTTRDHGEGTGVGLALCHVIVDRLRGRIEVESTPGVGSTFRIVLPAVRSERPAPVATESAGPLRVLVVDDEPLVADVLAGLLHDHEVTVAHSASEALQAVSDDHSFDAIFCDLMMPGMSGMDLYERLRAERADLAGRIVFVTGGPFTERARAFLGRVANPTLAKPFSRADVLRVLADRFEAG